MTGVQTCALPISVGGPERQKAVTRSGRGCNSVRVASIRGLCVERHDRCPDQPALWQVTLETPPPEFEGKRGLKAALTQGVGAAEHVSTWKPVDTSLCGAASASSQCPWPSVCAGVCTSCDTAGLQTYCAPFKSWIVEQAMVPGVSLAGWR